MLGMTQRQLAELVGVSIQQMNKYERGDDRIAAGRLFIIAESLDVSISYPFEGLEQGIPRKPNRQQQRAMRELGRYFMRIPSAKHQEALCAFARVLADNNVGTIREPVTEGQ